MAKSRRSYKGGAVSSVLAGSALAIGGTTITIASDISGSWPTGTDPFFVVIDPGTAKEEKVCVQYYNTTSLRVVDPALTSGWGASANGRGCDDTTDRQHEPGAVIYPVFTALEANQANELVSKYTTNGDLVVHGTSTVKTFPTGGSGNNNKVLIADSTVTDGGMKWASITGDSIAADAITSSKILDGTIVLGDLATALQKFLVPVGSINAYAGATAPTGWLLCDGTTSTSGYTALAALVGATTPDLRGKFPMGKTASGTGSTLLGTGGSNTIAEANLPSHLHTINHDHVSQNTGGQSADHNHGLRPALIEYVYSGGPLAQAVVLSTGGVDPTYNTGNNSVGHSHAVDIDAFTGNSGSTGSGTAYFQPFLSVNYIIKHD